ncbi:MAG: hypothetical protein QXL94_03075 [Candidatus Parvarchaeum sp.]
MADGEQKMVMTEEKLAEMISSIVNSAIDKKMENFRINEGSHNHTEGPKVLSQASISDIKPLHYQNFNIVSSGDEMEVSCPTCGGYQTHIKAPVVVKEKPVEVVKTKVPDNYMPVPTTFDDIKALLDDMEHPGGHHLWDCPNCSPKLEKYLKEHGWNKSEVKKK